MNLGPRHNERQEELVILGWTYHPRMSQTRHIIIRHPLSIPSTFEGHRRVSVYMLNSGLSNVRYMSGLSGRNRPSGGRTALSLCLIDSGQSVGNWETSAPDEPKKVQYLVELSHPWRELEGKRSEHNTRYS
jgi:hypothetical protein